MHRPAVRLTLLRVKRQTDHCSRLIGRYVCGGVRLCALHCVRVLHPALASPPLQQFIDGTAVALTLLRVERQAHRRLQAIGRLVHCSPCLRILHRQDRCHRCPFMHQKVDTAAVCLTLLRVKRQADHCSRVIGILVLGRLRLRALHRMRVLYPALALFSVQQFIDGTAVALTLLRVERQAHRRLQAIGRLVHCSPCLRILHRQDRCHRCPFMHQKVDTAAVCLTLLRVKR